MRRVLHRNIVSITIPCPLLGDEDKCEGVLTVRMCPGEYGTRDCPASGPYIDEITGPCCHARAWQAGDLTEDEEETIFEAAVEHTSEAEAEAYDDAMQARLEAYLERDWKP